MKGVQCYELFGGIALKNHTFSFFFSFSFFGVQPDTPMPLRRHDHLSLLTEKKQLLLLLLSIFIS